VQDPDKFFYIDQYSNPNNPLSHRATADEIWKQTKGKITHFVSAVGTGGTITGAGKRLKELNPAITTVEAQPLLKHKIQGLKNMKEAIIPSIYNPNSADIRIFVKDEEAFEMTRKLAKKGLLVGMSSGAALVAAVSIKQDDAVVVVIFPDGGMKYLSTNLFDEYDSKYIQAPNLYEKHELKDFSKEYLCCRRDENT
jgi:cysteine synthase B